MADALNLSAINEFAKQSFIRLEFKMSMYLFISIEITEEDLFQVILDLFLAGTDTTAGTLRWIILHLLHNRDAQKKCRDEIFKVC